MSLLHIGLFGVFYSLQVAYRAYCSPAKETSDEDLKNQPIRFSTSRARSITVGQTLGERKKSTSMVTVYVSLTIMVILTYIIFFLPPSKQDEEVLDVLNASMVANEQDKEQWCVRLVWGTISEQNACNPWQICFKERFPWYWKYKFVADKVTLWEFHSNVLFSDGLEKKSLLTLTRLEMFLWIMQEPPGHLRIYTIWNNKHVETLLFVERGFLVSPSWCNTFHCWLVLRIWFYIYAPLLVDGFLNFLHLYCSAKEKVAIRIQTHLSGMDSSSLNLVVINNMLSNLV